MRCSPFALLGAENGVALHEGDGTLTLLAFVVGVGGYDAVSIDNELAVLSLHHIAAKVLRLFECEPEGRGVTFGGCG